jgi:hypothetical protein
VRRSRAGCFRLEFADARVVRRLERATALLVCRLPGDRAQAGQARNMSSHIAFPLPGTPPGKRGRARARYLGSGAARVRVRTPHECGCNVSCSRGHVCGEPRHAAPARGVHVPGARQTRVLAPRARPPPHARAQCDPPQAPGWRAPCSPRHCGRSTRGIRTGRYEK